MRRLLGVFTVILFLIPLSLFSQQKNTIAVLDFTYPYGIEDFEAEQISEIIRTQIIITGEFTVLEKSQVDALFHEAGFQLSGMVNEDTIIDIGNILHADYIITGSIARLNEDIVITSRFVSAATGINIFAEKLSTNETAIFADLEEYAGAIANRAVELTYGITLGNVKLLIEMNSFEAAFQKLQLYREQHPDGPEEETAVLKERIDRGLAESLYDKAKIAFRNKYYGQALLYIERAMRYDRSGEIYNRFFDRAEKRYEMQLHKEYKALLNDVKALLRKGLYGEAEKVLDTYIRRKGITGKDGRILELYKRINEGYARKKYREAISDTRKNDFRDALEDVEEAITLEPEDERYVNYLSVIHRRSEAFNRSAYEMIERKPFFQSGYREPFTLHAAGQIQTFADPYRELKVRGVYPGAELGFTYFSRFVDPLFINFFSDAAITAGTNDQRFPEGTLTNSFWYLQLAGGLGGTLAFSYLDIGLGAGIHFGLLRGTYTDTIFGNTEEGTDSAFIFGPQISLRGSYYLTKQFAVTARYRLQWLLRISERTVLSHSISIGAGVNL
jgi:TolB-like protein